MYLKLLQFDSAEPISLVNGTFARFPEPMPDSFALDVVKGLTGYALVQGRYRGGQDPRSFPSGAEAARSIGISLTTLNRNKERNSKRPGELIYVTSKGIEFAAIRDERTDSDTGSID